MPTTSPQTTRFQARPSRPLDSESASPDSPSDPGSFSVVIPCHNQGEYLPTALDSVRAQSYPAAEIVVVDDGSTDETADVAATDPSVTYQWQPNQGLSAARNTGLALAQGEYVLFLDADDWLLPNALKAAKQAFAEAPAASFVAGGHVIHFEGSDQFKACTPHLNGDAYATLLRRNVIEMHGAVAYRRAVLEALGGFDEDLPACEDYDVYLRLARQGTLHVHEGLMAVYRRHPRNMSKNARLMLSSVLRVLDRQPVETPQHFQARKAGRQHYSDFYGSALARQVRETLFRKGALREATAAAAMLFRTAPALAVRKLGRGLERSLPRPARRALRRALGRPLQPGDVQMGDLRRTTPLSRQFGFDRGTPIDRHYIESFLDAHRDDIQGHVLEIAEDTYTRQFGGTQVNKSDVLHFYPDHPGATITGDLTKADHIPSNRFDCIILTQTLQLIYDVEAALETIHRILKPGGILLATVPGITPIPDNVEGEAWYWSFTRHSMARLAAEQFDAPRVEVESYGNVLAATSFLQGMALEEVNRTDLDQHDPDYEVIVGLRAEKSDVADAPSDSA